MLQNRDKQSRHLTGSYKDLKESTKIVACVAYRQQHRYFLKFSFIRKGVVVITTNSSAHRDSLQVCQANDNPDATGLSPSYSGSFSFQYLPLVTQGDESCE